MKIVLATLNAKYIHSSLALRYLKKYCQAVCRDIVIKEYTVNNELLSVLGDLFRERPAVVGLACYIWNIGASLELVRLLKKVMPETVIVLGGPEVTYGAAELLRENPGIDYIIQGEGEAALASLLAKLGDGTSMGKIPGVASRNSGEIFEGQPQIINELDSLPFPYDEADMAALQGKILYYESSRGCPYACQYCLSSATSGVRFLPVERVRAELAYFIEHGVKQVKFVDRTFNARRDHYLPILEFLAKQPTATNFHFEIAADILDDAVLDLLAAAPPGRFQFEIGVQSTNPATLAAIRRHNDWPKIVHCVNRLRNSNKAHLHLDLIAGLPYEAYSRFGESFNAVYGLRPHMLQIGFLKLLKGSGLRGGQAEHGYVFTDAAPYEVLANRYISYSEIRRLKMIEDAFNQTYNTGRFQATLEWLVRECGEAFELYEAFAAYWEEQGFHLIAHNGRTVFGYIADFCRRERPELAELCGQFLKFDALRDKAGSRPDMLPWDEAIWEDAKSEFWRNEALVRRYIPDYRFSTWRAVKKNYQLELFTVNIPAFLGGDHLRQERTALLYDYTGHDTAWHIVAPEDFPGRQP